MKSTVCFSALGCVADAFKRSAKEYLNPVPAGRRGRKKNKEHRTKNMPSQKLLTSIRGGARRAEG